MNVIERHNLILEHLKTTDCLTVEEIAKLTGASLPTVRRDLKILTEEYGLARFRGGVGFPAKGITEHLVNKKVDRAVFDEDPGYIIVNRLMVNREQKIQIAKKAAEYVKDGDTIYVDNSSSVYYMIEFIKGKEIMVVTNGVGIISKLLEYQIPTYVLNGQVNAKAHCILGMDTAEQLKSINFDKAFIGTRGIDKESGFTTTDNFDSMLKTIAISKAKESYVLADKSKFFQSKLYTYAGLSEATIITDDTNGFEAADARIALCSES